MLEYGANPYLEHVLASRAFCCLRILKAASSNAKTDSLSMNTFTITSRRAAAHNLYRSLWRTLRYSSPGLAKSNSLLQVRLRSSAAESMPKIAQASTWTSIIPRFLRNRSLPTDTSVRPKSKEWNPATFYIVIFTLIGSQAIQMLVLRKDFENYTRRAEAKLRLLTEVIQRVKNGENVDVERLLGTNDETKEREWEEGQTPAARALVA